MACLSAEEFDEKFPILLPARSRNHLRSIYDTIDLETIVKTQTLNSGAIKEAFLLSHFEHPNICPVSAVCFDNNLVRMALPAGETVIPGRKISLREILTDIVAGIAYLNYNGLIYGDLKKDSIVYHEGRVKLIDFGLVTITDKCRFENYESRFLKGNAYTGIYRDPQYNPKLTSCYKADMYSIAATIYYLYERKPDTSVETLFYINEEKFMKAGITDPNIINFLMELQKPMKSRKNLIDLLNHPALIKKRLHRRLLVSPGMPTTRYNVGEVMSSSLIMDDDKNMILKTCFGWLVEVCKKGELSIKILFAAQDIFMKYLSVNVIESKKYIQLYIIISLYIALSINNASASIQELLELTANLYTYQQFIQGLQCFFNSGISDWYSVNPYHSINYFEDIGDYATLVIKENYSNGYNYKFNRENKQIMIFKNNKRLESTKYIDMDVEVIEVEEFKENPVYFPFNVDEIPRYTLEPLLYNAVREARFPVYRLFFMKDVLDIFYQCLCNEQVKDLPVDSAGYLYKLLMANAEYSGSEELLSRIFDLEKLEFYKDKVSEVNIFRVAGN